MSASGRESDRVGYAGNESDAASVSHYTALRHSPVVSAEKYEPTVAAPTAK